MGKRLGWFAAAAAGIVGVGVLVRACDPIVVAPPTDFSYASHLRPRVFVSHEPLVPAPGTSVTIRIAPDLEPGTTVARTVASFRSAPGAAATLSVCTSAGDGTFTCSFALGGGDGPRVYGAHVELADGTRANARSEYQFTVRASLPEDELVAVRVPVGPPSGLSAHYRVDLAFLRDPENYSAASFPGDVATALFGGILADPVYRWRDHQLGFHVFMRPAFVESYYAPRDTRCGRNPYPRETAWPAALSDIEVVGVLHRKTTDPNGIEGSGAPPASVVFRDCAGEAAKRAGVGTFSANAALAVFPTIAKHEYGHAAFGLGDEYTEDTSTREVPPPPPVIGAGSCCCRIDDGTGGGTTVPSPGNLPVPGGRAVVPGGGGVPTGGGGVPTGGGTVVPGGGTKRCIAPGGAEQVTPFSDLLDGNLPSCTTTALPAHCGASSDSGCPGLAGNCVRAVAWLGATPPAAASTARPNLFPSEQACSDARQKAADHPSVENPPRSLGTCRQICGTGMAACPCVGGDAWIVDIDPAVATARPDTMGVAAADVRHGGTCQWCVETSLCVRWHRARGDDAATAWTACEAPPKSATQLERLWHALIECANAIVAAILKVIRF